MKNDYNRDTFWVLKDENGTPNYYIKVNGVMVPVSEEVYKVCKNSYMKIMRDNKRDMNNVLSLDKVNINQHTLLDYIRAKSDEDEQTIIYLLKTKISTLDDKTKIIMEKYFFQDKTIREIGKELKIAKSTVSDRLTKGIKILKKFIKNPDK